MFFKIKPMFPVPGKVSVSQISACWLYVHKLRKSLYLNHAENNLQYLYVREMQTSRLFLRRDTLFFVLEGCTVQGLHVFVLNESIVHSKLFDMNQVTVECAAQCGSTLQ